MIAADIKKQIIYLASVAVLRRLFADGQADKIMLERLNQKNAEKMNCIPLALGEFCILAKIH